jgi:biotin carboxylase
VASEEALAARPDAPDDVPGLELVAVPTDRDLVDGAMRYAAGHQVDGALTFSEELLVPTARFTDRAALRGLTIEAVERLRDKHLQLQALAEAGLPVPPFALVRSTRDVPAALDQVPLPAILKPTQGAGSFMTFVVTDEHDLREALEIAKGQPAAESNGSPASPVDSSEFVIESLIPGSRRLVHPGFAPYVSVESAAADGEYFHYAISDRFPVVPPALETGLMTPSALPADLQLAVEQTAERAMRALGFAWGIAHTELMLTEDGPRIIEVNGRPGGPLPDVFHRVSDVDIVLEAGKIALGMRPSRQATFRAHGVFVFPRHQVGARITAVDGLSKVAALPGVYEVIPLAVSGSTSEFHNLGAAAVLAEASTPSEAARLWKQVMALVRPRYEEVDSRPLYRRIPAVLATEDSDALTAEAPTWCQ